MSRDTWPARYEAGATLAQIADEDGVHPFTVDRHLSRAGVKMRPPGKKRSGDPRVWADLYRQGLSLSQIGAMHGCSLQCVHRHLKILGVKMRPAGGSRPRS